MLSIKQGLFSLLALSLAALQPCAAFLRTAPDIAPYQFSYPEFGPGPNIKEVIAYNESGIKSYWWANFLTGSNGHSYCVVITSANAGPNYTVSAMSVVDVTSGYNYATAINEPGQLSTTKFEGKSSVLHVGSTAKDQFSQTYAISTLPQFEFSLQYVPKGPLLYQGGSGFFTFGQGVAQTFDAVECYTTGWIAPNGTNVTIVSETSATWLDYQWGPGYAVGGWHDFVILLENGVRIQATVLKPYSGYAQAAFCTMMYPDGHQEVWPVDNNTYPANPWVSSLTNITYYQDYVLNIPAKDTVFYVHLPVKGGETAPSKGATNANSIADTFAWYNGTFEGLPVKGYGIMELREDAGCASYGGC